MYLVGTDIYTCTDRQNESGEQGTPYERRKSGSVEYTFKRENEFKLGYVEDKYIRVENSTDVYNEFHMPIQKVAVGAISTTRPVDMVEIGFKSTVTGGLVAIPTSTSSRLTILLTTLQKMARASSSGR